jgi:ribonuclease HI
MKPRVVYTDGACSGNPGPGGWAWAADRTHFSAGFALHTTNQRMEILAAFESVKAFEGPLEVVSDSTYVVNCFRDSWWEGWLKRGWLNSQKEPVANRDLWEPFIELVRERRDVKFRWVKGHAGDRMNDFVDQLAVEACRSQKARRSGGDRNRVAEKEGAPAPSLGHLPQPEPLDVTAPEAVQMISTRGAPMNLLLGTIKQAMDDIARAKGIRKFRVEHKRNQRGELVIALIVEDKDGPLGVNKVEG